MDEQLEVAGVPGMEGGQRERGSFILFVQGLEGSVAQLPGLALALLILFSGTGNLPLVLAHGLVGGATENDENGEGEYECAHMVSYLMPIEKISNRHHRVSTNRTETGSQTPSAQANP
jgi:hypothetical protein